MGRKRESVFILRIQAIRNRPDGSEPNHELLRGLLWSSSPSGREFTKGRKDKICQRSFMYRNEDQLDEGSVMDSSKWLFS